MNYQVGSIVRARGREWVVQPEGADPALVLLKPLGGSDAEVVGILPSLEPIESASFSPPNPADLGDWTSARLLKEAARLSTRNAAGSLRCWSRIDAEPRPYQLVPLLMALKLDPVRILLADDVGIGKTIEALLVARELFDRGEIRRMTVLAPPSLVDQWVREMDEKFHLEAVPVLAGTAGRLENKLMQGRTLFEEYPITVVSLDFIKAEKRQAEFLRTCPEFVIVDEAHSCAPGPGIRHLRFELLRKLAEDRSRHLLLVTATPHSGKDEAFGSLVGLLGPEIARAAAEGRDIRDLLGPRMVQRRRPDIRKYLETTTSFPRRLEKESKYLFTDAYSRLFRRVLEYIQGSMSEVEAGTRQHRIRWWSALALLRALSSSPQAVAATLRTRAAPADGQTAREADEIGKSLVLDQDALDGAEGMDAVSGSAEEDEGAAGSPDQRKLRDLAREAESLSPSEDAKLQILVKEVKALLAEKYAPIVFCRFIETAEYVWRHLRDALEKDGTWKGRTEAACVNGTLDPEDRQARIDQLDREFLGDRIPILVATDCLSEGINLQGLFTAVIHYDLAWNPTRHEQREGRVDRFGQRAETVKCLTIYGANNPVDGIVLDVLIRKHKIIKDRTGVAIPVPMDSNDVLAAILEGFNFRSAWTGRDAEQVEFDFGQDLLLKRKRLHDEWEDAADRDKENRTRFAQRTIDPAEVARELAELREAAGDREALRWFMHRSLERLGAVVTESGTSISVNPKALPAWIKDQTGLRETARYEFGDEPAKGAVAPTRSHPTVAALAAHVLETALDPAGHGGGPVASRAGYIKTTAVRTMTTLLLVRYRYDISVGRGEARRTDLAEDVGAFAWRWGPAGPEYLPPGEAEALFSAEPTDNADPALARDKLAREIERLGEKRDALAAEARRRAGAYSASFERLREAARLPGGRASVVPRGEPDILGIYIYQPGGRS